MLDGYSSIPLNARPFGKTYRERDDVPIERAHLSKMIGNQRRNGALKPGQKIAFPVTLFIFFSRSWRTKWLIVTASKSCVRCNASIPSRHVTITIRINIAKLRGSHPPSAIFRRFARKNARSKPIKDKNTTSDVLALQRQVTLITR